MALSETRVKFYVMQIRMGKMTIDKVPAAYKARVQKTLDDGEYMPGHVNMVGDDQEEI